MFPPNKGRVPITILQLNGNLDASNYTEPIQKAQELFAGGARDLVIDLSNVPHISSAGLMAIHTLALIFGGTQTSGTHRGSPHSARLIQARPVYS